MESINRVRVNERKRERKTTGAAAGPTVTRTVRGVVAGRAAAARRLQAVRQEGKHKRRK